MEIYVVSDIFLDGSFPCLLNASMELFANKFYFLFVFFLFDEILHSRVITYKFVHIYSVQYEMVSYIIVIYVLFSCHHG